MRWIWPDRNKIWSEKDLMDTRNPGLRFLPRRKRFSFYEEIFTSADTLWRRAFTTKEKSRY